MNTIRFFALTLASLLTVSALFSCTTSVPATTSVNTPQDPAPVEGRKGMTPSEIREILPQVEWIKFKVECETYTNFSIDIYTKNGSNLYYEHENRSLLSGGWTRYNRYIDCATGTYYESKINTTEWYTHQGSKDAWSNLINAYFFNDEAMNLALHTEVYLAQNADGSYDGNLRKFPTSVKSVNFQETETAYIFKIQEEDTTLSIDGKPPIITTTIHIWFTRLPVTLPTHSKPDPLYTQPAQTTTTAPSEPPTPETIPPAQQMGLPENYKTPSEIFNQLLTASDATMNLQHTVGGTNTSATLEIDNSIIYLTETTSAGTRKFYFDLKKHMQYAYEDGTWYYQADNRTWTNILGMLSKLMNGSLAAKDENFTYQADTDQIVLNQEALEQYHFTSMTLQQTRLSALCTMYLYTLTYSNGETLTLEFSLTHDQTLSLPDARPAGFPVGISYPQEILEHMTSATDATLSIQYTTPHYSSKAILKKDGDIIEIQEIHSNYTELTYYDTANKRYYEEEDGIWISYPGSLSWINLIYQICEQTETHLTTTELVFEYNADTKLVVMKENYLNRFSMESITIQQSKNGYTITAITTDPITTVIEFKIGSTSLKLPTVTPESD